jgi:hypothetical protein
VSPIGAAFRAAQPLRSNHGLAVQRCSLLDRSAGMLGSRQHPSAVSKICSAGPTVVGRNCERDIAVEAVQQVSEEDARVGREHCRIDLIHV